MEDLSNMLTTVSPTDGHSLSVVGDTYRVLISGKQTGGSYASEHTHEPLFITSGYAVEIATSNFLARDCLARCAKH